MHHVIILLPGLCPQAETLRCGGDYIITQDDIDGGRVHNTGAVSCVDSEKNPIAEEDTNTVDTLGTAGISLGQ